MLDSQWPKIRNIIVLGRKISWKHWNGFEHKSLFIEVKEMSMVEAHKIKNQIIR